jgi:hypothetical protein
METILKHFKSDFQHVFIEGDAESQELVRVFVVLDIPLMLLILLVCHFV